MNYKDHIMIINKTFSNFLVEKDYKDEDAYGT